MQDDNCVDDGKPNRHARYRQKHLAEVRARNAAHMAQKRRDALLQRVLDGLPPPKRGRPKKITP